MENFLQTLLYDPFFGKVIATVVGIIIINLIVRFLQRLAFSRLESKEIRYSVRRGLTIFGNLAAALFVIGIFSNQLSNITVALGVVGTGIAFALQEVIVSVTGWALHAKHFSLACRPDRLTSSFLLPIKIHAAHIVRYRAKGVRG